MNRTLRAARLHVLRPTMAIGLPWLIVAASFVVNLVVWGTAPVEDASTGGILALYIVLLVTFAQAPTQLLPIAMGAGLSRRTFFLGTALYAMALSVVYGVTLTALAGLEHRTAGWGVGMYFWSPGGFVVDNPAFLALIHCSLLLLSATIGLGMGLIYKRWGTAGMYVASAAVVVLGGGAIALIGSFRAWDQISDWFGAQSPGTLGVGIPLILTAAMGLLSFLALRRVVP
jgi:hypothetical protein